MATKKKVEGEGMEELRGAPWTALGNAEPGPDGRKGVSLCLKGDANVSILHFKKRSPVK